MKRHTAPIIAAALLLLPVLYVGSYLALVLTDVQLVDYLGKGWDLSNYRVGGDTAATFFWPLEQIDRRLRPEAWGPEPIP